MNKRGDVGNIMEDAVSLFVIIMLVVSFFVFSSLYFKFTEKQIDLKIEQNSKFSEIEFAVGQIRNLNFEINGETISFSDLARLSKIDSKSAEILNSKLAEINTGKFGIEIKEISYDSSYKNYGDSSYLIIPSYQPIVFEIIAE